MKVWSWSLPGYHRVLHEYSWLSVFVLSSVISSVFFSWFAFLSVVFDHIILLITQIWIVIVLVLWSFVFGINLNFGIRTWLFYMRGSLNNRFNLFNPIVLKYTFQSWLRNRRWRSLFIADRWLTTSIFSDHVR